VFSYTYDLNGRLESVVNADGTTTRNEYDGYGYLVRSVTNWNDGVFDPSEPDTDIETRYQYDANGNTIIVTGTLGRMTRTFYEGDRVQGRIANWDGHKTLADCAALPDVRDENICTQYAYDVSGYTVIVTDTLGRMTRTFYDAQGQVEARVANWNPATLSSPADCVLSPTNESVENVCTLYGYDTVGRQITATNALNQSSLTVYDEINRPVISVANWDDTPIDEEADCAFPPAQPDTNLCTVIYYDARGQRSAIKDPLGNEIEYGYDAQGRLITTTRYLDGGPVVSVSHYDALTCPGGQCQGGNRIGQIDARGNTATYVYDELGRLVTTLSPAGVEMTQGYDAVGRVVTMTDGLDHSTTIDYDALGRRVATTDAEGHVTRYVYDGLGNQVAMTDANSVRTSYGYDGLGRLISVVENDTGDASTHDSNVLTRYAYDALGNRIVITNALGYTSTHTTYDVLGRPITVKDALGHETLTRYNALGYRTVVTDANGSVTRYSYDGLNRLISVQYPDSNVQYAYDALGNRMAMTDTLGVTRYEYDDLYRLVSVTDLFTGTVAYSHDLAGNRTQLTYPDGKVVTYTYNADNRLLQVQDWDSGLTRYAYDAAGRLISTTLPNGVVTTQQYDDANRLVNLAHTAADDTLLASFSYEMDGVGNRTQITEVLAQPGTGITTTTTITYDYDPLQRLTDADYSSGERLQYAYDGAGNMTAVTATITSTVVTTKTYDAANRLTTITTEGAVRTLDWSAAGELLRDGDDTYTWDAAGRLISATVDGTMNRYAYLGDGGRISMTVGSETMTYTLDLAAPLVQVLAVNGNGGDVAYLYGLARIGEYDSEWRYHLADHLGSVRSLVGADGSVKGTQTYQPYGSPLSTAGTASSMYGFTGEQTDPTGLVYLRARVYAPSLMQFTRRDLWSGHVLQPDSINGFNFVNANPVCYIDPTGYQAENPCSDWWLPQRVYWCDRIERDHNLGRARNLYYFIGDMGRMQRGWGIAEDLLDHHLEGNGQPVELVDKGPWLLQAPQSREVRDKLLNKFIHEHLLPVAHDCHNDYAEAMLMPKDFLEEERKNFLSIPNTTTDVGVALGKHYINGMFKAQVLNSDGDKFLATLQVVYWVDDIHDFDENKALVIRQAGIGTVPHKWMKWLEDAGKAHEFSVHLEWNEQKLIIGSGSGFTTLPGLVP
jgi:RHS repeat-associated protein